MLMSAERIWANSAAAGLLLLAALLIFANLDDRRLLDDEAETDRHVFRDPGDRPKITLYEKAQP